MESVLVVALAYATCSDLTPHSTLHTIEYMSPYLWMCLSTFLMALMGTMTHHLGHNAGCPWQITAFVRMFGMLLVMIPILRASRVKFPWRASANLWGRTLAGTCAVMCTFFSLSYLPVSDATTLYHTAPIWIVLFSWIAYGRIPDKKICVAVLCCMAGILIVHQPHFLTTNSTKIIAVIAAAGTAMFMAVAFMNLNAMKHVPSLAIVVHFSLWGSVILFFLCFFTHCLTPDAMPKHFYPDVFLLTGVGLAGAAGQIALTKAYKNGKTANVAVVGLSQVIFAAVFEMILWGRAYTVFEAFGFAMILVPIAMIILKEYSETEA